jgi:hypothetical protein
MDSARCHRNAASYGSKKKSESKERSTRLTQKTEQIPGQCVYVDANEVICEWVFKAKGSYVDGLLTILNNEMRNKTLLPLCPL